MFNLFSNHFIIYFDMRFYYYYFIFFWWQHCGKNIETLSLGAASYQHVKFFAVTEKNQLYQHFSVFFSREVA